MSMCVNCFTRLSQHLMHKRNEIKENLVETKNKKLEKETQIQFRCKQNGNKNITIMIIKWLQHW